MISNMTTHNNKIISNKFKLMKQNIEDKYNSV